jgi:hypothetical protein
VTTVLRWAGAAVVAVAAVFALVWHATGGNPRTAFGGLLVIAASAGCAVFVTLYTAWYPWYRSETGVHLTAFVGCLGILDTLFSVSVFAPHSRLVQALLLAAFVPEPFIVWWRVSLLLRTRRAGDGADRRVYVLNVGAMAAPTMRTYGPFGSPEDAASFAAELGRCEEIYSAQVLPLDAADEPARS